MIKELEVLLNFVGKFVEDSNIEEIPQEAGLYVVFICKKSSDGYSYQRIAYIGKAAKTKTSNLRERMRAHVNNDFRGWRKDCELSDDEIFVYSYAIYGDEYLEDVESALIFKYKPILNVQGKDDYTSRIWLLKIDSCGDIGLLKSSIYVPYIVSSSL